MSKYGNVRTIEQKIRSSMSYSRWVSRNKAPSCLACGGINDLECHHVVDLYQIVLGWWKYYADEEATFQQVIAMHDNDHCENVTLCSECHAKKHPLRTQRTFKGSTMRTDNWAAFPRCLKVPLSQSTRDKTTSSLGLIGFQVLLSIGWYVLKGYMESRIIEINRRSLAKLLGKKCPGTSFNKSLDETLEILSRLAILNGYHLHGNKLELHLSSDYLNQLGGNPWFISLNDLSTSSMCALTLRWHLCTQSNRKIYKIGLDKLKVHLGMTIKDNWMAAKAIKNACNEIKWVKVEMGKDMMGNDMCTFKITKRGATPINDLRSTLQDSIKHGT